MRGRMGESHSRPKRGIGQLPNTRFSRRHALLDFAKTSRLVVLPSSAILAWWAWLKRTVSQCNRVEETGYSD